MSYRKHEEAYKISDFAMYLFQKQNPYMIQFHLLKYLKFSDLIKFCRISKDAGNLVFDKNFQIMFFEKKDD